MPQTGCQYSRRVDDNSGHFAITILQRTWEGRLADQNHAGRVGTTTADTHGDVQGGCGGYDRT